jgi:hypothetical protein
VSNWWRGFNSLRRLRNVRTTGDAWLLARVAVVATLVPVLMRLPLARVRTVLEPRGEPPAANLADEHRLIGLVNLALDALRPLLRATCLTRGITRYYFLRRAGVDVSLAFGIARTALAEVAGHCWLVRDGEPFLEARDPRPAFAEVYRISPSSSTPGMATC